MGGLFLLLFLPYFQTAPIPDSEEYLNKYGYSKPPQLADNAGGQAKNFQETKKDGLKALQESLGLKQTGVLDKDTVEEMQKPRCGMKYQDPASLRGSGGIVRDYPKWKKTELRYKLAPLDEKRKANSTKASAKETLAALFKMWSEVTPLKFERVASFSSRDKYDIEVKFMKGEHGDGSAFDGLGGELAHAFYPPSGKLHIDDDENFLFSDYSKLSKSKPFNYVDLLYVAAHEGGHLLGLDHSANNASIMYPTYSPKFDKSGNYILPKLDKIDIETIQQIYGQNPDALKTTTAASTTPERRVAEGYDTTTPAPHQTHIATKPSVPLSLELPKVDPQTECPYVIDSFVRPSYNNPSVPLLFTGYHVMYQSKQPPYFHLITDIFPNGPETVDTAAMADRDLGLLLLFKDRKIYGYFETFRNGVLNYTEAGGFPKELSADVDFDVEGAVRAFKRGHIILLSNKETNKQYFYDYNINVVTYKKARQGKAWYVPPGVRTFISDKGTRGTRYEMFTRTHAYVYLDGHSKPDKVYPISKAFGSCPKFNVLS